MNKPYFQSTPITKNIGRNNHVRMLHSHEMKNVSEMVLGKNRFACGFFKSVTPDGLCLCVRTVIESPAKFSLPHIISAMLIDPTMIGWVSGIAHKETDDFAQYFTTWLPGVHGWSDDSLSLREHISGNEMHYCYLAISYNMLARTESLKWTDLEFYSLLKADLG